MGIEMRMFNLPKDATTRAFIKQIVELNDDEAVNGIIVELPLPKGMDRDEVVSAIHPDKDIDGLSPLNLGRLAQGKPRLAPCTPMSVMHILSSEGVALKGRDVAVVNHSIIVGRPLVHMLLAADATVKVAHVFTKDLKAHTKEAEVLITAAGVPNLIGPHMVREGAIVIDCGMNRLPDGKLVGDVDFERVKDVASAITPVPGGVGPVTVAMLLENVVKALEFQGVLGKD
jgi:methylenetetrahydrofolate dehydrogenase (NADP+)/methenyltetrahydrofolate cyclohydrolase